jgi:LuxR family transcriptional regulator, positive regulator of biofilm formation
MLAVFTDPQIEIVGPNRMQNELLMSIIEKETGLKSRCRSDLKSCFLSKNNSRECLILLDCTGKASCDIDAMLAVDGVQNGGGCGLVLFNIEPSREICMEKLVEFGVRGVFFLDDATGKIIRGLQAIIAGELWYPRGVLSRCILTNTNGFIPNGKGLAELTFREKEILRKIADGKANKEIADELGISLNTVKTHVYKIYKKIEVGSRMQAAIWAGRHLS